MTNLMHYFNKNKKWLDPGNHFLSINGINSSRTRGQSYFTVDLLVADLYDRPSNISIRVYDDKSKDYVNRMTTSFLKTILTTANFPLDQEREPDWTVVSQALKGVIFEATVRAKEGGVPFLTSLEVASDIRTGDPWGVGPEEAERLRAFSLNDQDNL